LSINYYKPLLNRDFTTKTLESDTVLNDLKCKHGVDKIVLIVDLAGFNYMFWSERQEIKSSQVILDSDYNYKEFDLADINKS